MKKQNVSDLEQTIKELQEELARCKSVGLISACIWPKKRDATGWKHADRLGAYKIPACSTQTVQHVRGNRGMHGF